MLNRKTRPQSFLMVSSIRSQFGALGESPSQRVSLTGSKILYPLLSWGGDLVVYCSAAITIRHVYSWSLIDPSSEYNQRLETRRRQLVQAHRQTRIIASLRLAAGLLFFLSIYFSFGLHRFSAWWISVPSAAYVGLVIYSLQVYPREQRAL